MCGIFGVIARPGALERRVVEQAVSRLFLLSETRGKESAGLAIAGPAAITFQKSAQRPRDFIASSGFAPFLRQAVDAVYGAGEPFAMFGHSRLVTNGAQNLHANNQPVLAGGILGVHNGIIVNDEALWRTMNDAQRTAEVDTEVMLQLLRQRLGRGEALPAALRSTFRQLLGTVSTALVFEDLDCIALATNNGSLYVARNAADGTTVFASERYILEEFLGTAGLNWPASPDDIRQIEADSALLIELGTLEGHAIGLGEEAFEAPQIAARHRDIRDETPAETRDHAAFNSAPQVRHADFSRFEVDREPIRALRRCTCCVLPETVPFIAFDEKGVCNFCNSHKPKTYLGRAALAAEAERLKARRGDASADCLITLSGGRDSSYGIHYAVKELGLKPIAYTYDWGMITDLARRNQARMCGALKVEHILVSADIADKRDNIRRNVSAWLKRPALGIIPLFMAGDKQYFYHANDLAKKLHLDATVLASNPLEKTHFKAGFCGVPPTLGHRPSLFAQLQMAAYYGKEFLLNPSYFNKSLVDTSGAFLSYYSIKHEYLRLFDYIPWVESEVNDTLLGQYDWETANDTRSTWRIGDGTAAFYNYIYYRVAGFSENDTFRSNQIREGMIDRDTALRLVETENAPRFESIAWYCSVIGLDPTEVLQRIAQIPTLYPSKA
jgi:glucosamine--fructose-6-phosphate aminotransferase (isomerizing)